MKRQAFTLVELIVVILILGILAGVAAPKFIDTSDDAATAAVRQTLAVVRDAIELYTAENGGVPPHNGNASGAGSLEENLRPYLRNGIPACPVGTNDDTIGSTTDATTSGATPARNGWVYNTNDGSFVCGFSGPLPDGSANYDQL